LKKRLDILNLWVDPVDMDQALERVVFFVEQGSHPHCIFAVNPEKNFSVPKDPELWELFRQADLLIPDGIGVVVAARVLHGARFSRVPGVQLMHRICKLSSERGYKVFIYGSDEEVNREAAARLEILYPGIRIAGRSNGYVPPEKMDGLVDQINQSGAQVLFLALGSPRQEKWYASHRDALTNVRVCQGIGGTLDTIAGKVKLAPENWQRLGLEWLYRLLSEPSRIKRQRVLPVFAVQVLWARLKKIFQIS
jgi:N-acetylglucosaminyldiphosphoundecaprenol N-acetyl-beta-D-mannosaminyltransferase